MSVKYFGDLKLDLLYFQVSGNEPRFYHLSLNAIKLCNKGPILHAHSKGLLRLKRISPYNISPRFFFFF